MKWCDKTDYARSLDSRIEMIDGVIVGKYTVEEAAKRLQLSVPYVYALTEKAQKLGLTSLKILKKRGKPHIKFTDEKRKKIQCIYMDYCRQCYDRNIKAPSFALFNRTLKEKHTINISYSQMYIILKEVDFQSPYKHKPKKNIKGHPYKERVRSEGELWLADGSPFNWLGGKELLSLHIIQDDATGNLVSLFLQKNECFFGYAEALKQAINKFGCPTTFKTDRARIFFTPKKLQEENTTITHQLKGIKAGKTQMGEILENELGIHMTPTFTPEAKGRVERVGGTLQRILPFLFMQNNIDDIDSANKFLKEYIDIFNKQFSVVPAEKIKKYSKLKPEKNLTEIFSIKKTRTPDIQCVFSFNNYKFRVIGDYRKIRKKEGTVYLNLEWGMKFKIGDIFYEVELLNLDKNKKALSTNRPQLPIVWQDLFEKYIFLPAKKESRNHLAS